jgi:transcriptional/translational regulatory protein YebC/TACO1
VRAVADVRHALSKNGGNLGTDGSVSFLFKHCGSIFFAPLDDSEALMDEAINLGADDVIINDDKSIEIITAPNDFTKINEGLEKLGFKKELAELTMKAENEINLKGDDASRMQKILDILEDLDDVQEVYTNANFEE